MAVDVFKYMSAVPQFGSFPGVDAHKAALEKLAADFPDIARLRRVGTSRLGEPISMMSIGTGPRNALMFASAHPDEPIGALTIAYLAELLCRDEALRGAGEVTWHLIPCINPDEFRLNEGWFEPPFSVGRFATHCYRPPMHRDLEWSFPFFYKENFYDRTQPETQMLMRVIDDLQPEFLGSLHNNVFGGVYYYLSKADEQLARVLQEIAAAEDLPLRLGEPETPYVQELSPGVLLFPSGEDQYEYEVAAGADPESLSLPTSSLGYASKYVDQSIIVEMAYFDDARVADLTPLDYSKRELIRDSTRISEEGLRTLEPMLAEVSPDLRSNSVYEESVRANLVVERLVITSKAAWAESAPETLAPATTADMFANRQEVKVRRLINLGTFIRMLETEATAGHATPVIRRNLEQARALFAEWERDIESELEVRVVPIRKLVSVQLGAVLATVLGS